MAMLTSAQVAGIILLSIIIILILLLAVMKIYVYLTSREKASPAKMNGKTVIVTGANSGIGKETARELASRGARVIMACRNLDSANLIRAGEAWATIRFLLRAKGELPEIKVADGQIKSGISLIKFIGGWILGDSGKKELIQNSTPENIYSNEIVKETKNQNVIVKKLDLSSLASVRTFAAEINKTESRLDVLIHNAGVAYTFEKIVTKDDLEITMATNHYGPFLLTHLLIDLLKQSKPSRIVVVASELYRIASNFNINMINPVGFWLPGYLYYYSKYVNILFTLELARKLENTGITVNCLHPGMIDSGIWRNVPFPFNLFLLPLTKMIFKSPEEGCQTTVHCAVAPELENVSGKYFMNCKEHALARYIKDDAIAKKVWELSEPLVKLEPTDPRI